MAKHNQSMWDKFNEGFINYEPNLPYPYVEYQKFEWWVLRFSEEPDSKKYVCECFKPSLEKYWEKEINRWNECYGLKWDEAFELKNIGTISTLYYEQFLNDTNYKKNLCHRCNDYPLPLLYTTSKKNSIDLRWYWVRFQNSLEYETLRLNPNNKKLFEEYDKCNSRINYLSNQYDEKSFEEHYGLKYELDKYWRKIRNLERNYVREEFGLKKVGEMWVNETLIYRFCKSLFPEQDVIFHYRGKELEGLEIDIFIKSLKIGIEYNGKQHYKAVKIFGGETALKKVKQRDKLKKELCKKLGYKLIEIKYTETVSQTTIKDKIDMLLNN